MRYQIIYHKSDLDGVFSAAIAAIALKRMGAKEEEITFNGWTYGNEVPGLKEGSEIYILDLTLPDMESVVREAIGKGSSITWIDHHKTAIETYKDSIVSMIKGIRRIGTAAVGLTYEFFFGVKTIVPKFVDYLSRYDVWRSEDKDWEDVIGFQYYVRAKVGLDVGKAIELFNSEGYSNETKPNVETGKLILGYIGKKNENEVLSYAFKGKVNGMNAVFMNTTEFNSTTFNSAITEDIEVVVPFCILPDGKVRLSLYYVGNREDGDISGIAKSFGGGGHAKASGFQLDFDSDKFQNMIKNHTL